jgi:hypothetical protein
MSPSALVRIRQMPSKRYCFANRSRADVFKSEGSNRRHLLDVFTGFRPTEMGRIAGLNDNANVGIRLQLTRVELITQADVENAGDNWVDSILRMPVWHQLYADPDRIRAGLGELTGNDGQSNRRWERREAVPRRKPALTLLRRLPLQRLSISHSPV